MVLVNGFLAGVWASMALVGFAAFWTIVWLLVKLGIILYIEVEARLKKKKIDRTFAKIEEKIKEARTIKGENPDADVSIHATDDNVEVMVNKGDDTSENI